MKTIKWYKVKCSFFNEEFGIRLWEDVIAFVKKFRGFDLEITAQYTDLFEGVNAMYENNEFKAV